MIKKNLQSKQMREILKYFAQNIEINKSLIDLNKDS